MANLKPLDDRVVIEPMVAEERHRAVYTSLTPQKEKPMKGKIIAVGEGKLLESGKRGRAIGKKGDKVLYGKYAGTEVTVDGKDLLVMRESDILV